MTYEVLDGTTNVVRFPIEERARPSIELMRDIRPDVRVLLANAETFGFEAPSPMLRSLADRETACHIEASMSQGELPSAEFVADLVELVAQRGRSPAPFLRGGQVDDRTFEILGAGVALGAGLRGGAATEQETQCHADDYGEQGGKEQFHQAAPPKVTRVLVHAYFGRARVTKVAGNAFLGALALEQRGNDSIRSILGT